MEYVPFNHLLPKTAVLIHHGGIGTTAQALAAGIPQLVVPMSHDQPDNARRLQRLGVAEMIQSKALTRTAVVEKLNYLLTSPPVQARCVELASRVDFGWALAQTCAAITTPI